MLFKNRLKTAKIDHNLATVPKNISVIFSLDFDFWCFKSLASMQSAYALYLSLPHGSGFVGIR